MQRLSEQQFALDEPQRVLDLDIKPGVLLGLRCVIRPGEAIQLPFYVTGRTDPLAPDYSTGVYGRLVTRKLKPLSCNIELVDGYFSNALLAKAVGDIALKGEGYALAISQSQTGLPPQAVSVLLSA